MNQQFVLQSNAMRIEDKGKIFGFEIGDSIICTTIQKATLFVPLYIKSVLS